MKSKCGRRKFSPFFLQNGNWVYCTRTKGHTGPCRSGDETWTPRKKLWKVAGNRWKVVETHWHRQKNGKWKCAETGEVVSKMTGPFGKIKITS